MEGLKELLGIKENGSNLPKLLPPQFILLHDNDYKTQQLININEVKTIVESSEDKTVFLIETNNTTKGWGCTEPFEKVVELANQIKEGLFVCIEGVTKDGVRVRSAIRVDMISCIFDRDEKNEHIRINSTDGGVWHCANESKELMSILEKARGFICV